MMLLIVLLLLCYLVGSTPSSIIMARLLKGIDIREHGSGNAGGTNVYRVLGAKPALVVVAVDIFKGWVAAALIAPFTFGGSLGELPFNNADLLAILCGSAAVLGHTYTVFGGFRGGKGVGTLAGMVLHLAPLVVPLGLAAWAVVLVLSGYVGLSSIIAVALFPVVVYLRDGTLLSTVGTFSIVIALFILFTHRGNIQRMLAGNESRFEKARIFHRSKK